MKLKLDRIKDEAEGVKTFIFVPQSSLSWEAGQFIHYTLHHEPTDDRGSDRWFTISSAPFEGNPQITTRIASKEGSSFKKALFNMKVGDEIEAEEPEGDFTIPDADKEYIFLAGGLGITPYHSIFLDLDHQGKKINVHLIYSNRDENITFKETFEQLQKKHPELKIDYIVGDRITPAKLKELAPDYQEKMVYLSGPEPMVESLGDDLKKAGLPEAQLKQDFFPGYEAE